MLLPLKLSVDGQRATKSLPDLTTFPTSNHFKNDTRYKLAVFSIYSKWWLHCSYIILKVRYRWSVQKFTKIPFKICQSRSDFSDYPVPVPVAYTLLCRSSGNEVTISN